MWTSWSCCVWEPIRDDGRDRIIRPLKRNVTFQEGQMTSSAKADCLVGELILDKVANDYL